MRTIGQRALSLCHDLVLADLESRGRDVCDPQTGAVASVERLHRDENRDLRSGQEWAGEVESRERG